MENVRTSLNGYRLDAEIKNVPVSFVNALRRILLADALASGATGLLMAAAPLGTLLGLPAGLLRAAGLLLLPYAVLVAWLALRHAPPPRRAVRAVVTANAIWAADSLVLLLSGQVAPTAVGTAFVLVQAAVVAGFAVLQALALRGRAGVAAQPA